MPALPLVIGQELAYTVGVIGDNTVGIHSALTCEDTLVGLDERPTLYVVASPEVEHLRVVSARRKRRDALLASDREEERAAILAALASGTRQVEVCAITGFTREYIRRITRDEARRNSDVSDDRRRA